jgi:hypothetical protein
VKRDLLKSLTLAAICLLTVFSVARAAQNDSVYRYRKGFHLSPERPPTKKELSWLINGIKSLTGFSAIKIDSNGDLTIADPSQFSGGSARARDLFTAALDGDESFTIESREHSAQIAFAQLDSVLRYSDGTGRSFEDWRIRIDFADFRELRGDEAAIASFGPGMAFMHELTHAILRYPDPVDANDQLGDCERYLNRIRSELKLPLREHYYPKNRLAVALGSLSEISQGTITFVQDYESPKKQKEFPVTFDLNKVFDLSKARPRGVVWHSELLARRSTQ